VFRGLAQNHAFGSFVAAAAEVSINPQGRVKVLRIVAATDPGTAVNPAQIERQFPAPSCMAVGVALCEITSRTAWSNRRTSTLQRERIAEMPQVDTIVMPSADSSAGGRAHHRGAAPGPQCDRRRPRQAHPLGAVEEHRLRSV